MRTAPHADNLLLGKGAIYCDILDANGNRTGEFHLGNCTRGETSQSDEMKQMYSSMDSDAGLYKEALLRRTLDLNITGTEFSPENMPLIFMGTEISVTQAAGTLTDYAFAANVKAGRWYEVGKRAISNVVVKASNVANAAVVTTDYQVDAVRGRIYIVPGGALDAAAAPVVSCSHNALANATALPAIAGGTVGKFTCYIRFVGDPSAGPAMEVDFWKVSLTRDGPLGLISDDWGNFNLKAKIENDTAGHPTDPYFRVIRPIATDA